LVEANGKGCFVLTFVGVSVTLLRFIVFPFKLLKLQKGIDYNEASIIIEVTVDVNDSLTFSNCQIRARSNIPPNYF
jgi:hypothetical protein